LLAEGEGLGVFTEEFYNVEGFGEARFIAEEALVRGVLLVSVV
jgi:hypothetical protein